MGPAPKNPPPLRSVILRKVREVIEGKANAVISMEKGNSNARAPLNNTSPKENLELPVVECVKEEPPVDNLGSGSGSFTKEATLGENLDMNHHTRFEEKKPFRTSSPDSSLEGREPKQEPDSPKFEDIKAETNMNETLEKCKCEDTSALTESAMLCDAMNIKENSPLNHMQCDDDKNDAEIPTLDMSVEVEQPTPQENNLSEAQANPSSKKSSDRKRKLFQDVLNTSLRADSKQSPRGLLAGKEKCAESGGKRLKLSDSQQSKSPDDISRYRTPSVFVEKEKSINAPSKITKAVSSKTRERKRKLFEESDVLNTAFIADDNVQPSGRQPEKEKRDKNAGKFPRGKISQLSKKQNLLDVPRFSTKVTSWGPNPPSKTFQNQFHSKAPRSQNLFGDFDVFNTAFLADDDGSPYDHLPEDLKKYHMGLTPTRKTDEKMEKINKHSRPEPKKTETATKEKKKKQQEIKHYSVNDYDFYAFFETSSEDEESVTQERESDDEDWAPDPEPEPEPIFVNPFKKKKGQNVKNHPNNRDSAKKESTGEKKQVFECDQCDRTFDDCWASMCAHRIQEHPSIEPHTCEICQIPCFDDTGLIKHMSEVHSIAGFVERKLDYIFCPDCDEKHPLGLTYLFHREESHECCILTCNLCDFTAHHRFQMKTHMQKVHDQIYFKNYSGDVTLTKVATREIPPPQSLRPYSCCICGEEIVKGESMKHKKEKHLEELKLGFYHCVVCEKVFHSLHSISSHFLTHFKTTKCPICSTIFRNYGKEYREHIKTVHCGIKHTHCEECNVILGRHSGTDHFRKVHENKRRHLCSTCGRGFKTRHALHIHNMIHTGEKPIRCKICSYRCRQKTALDWHITKRHPYLLADDKISDDKKRWGYNGRPPRKARTKKNSNVKVRELKSPKKPKVQAEKIQTVDSTYGRGFKTQQAFNAHNLIHTGKKPIRCEHCSYRCQQKSALDWHITRRHPHLKADDQKRQGQPPEKIRTNKNSNVKVQELKSPQKQKVQAERIQTVDSTYGQGFKTQHTLNVHNVIDTFKKPIQCEHCSYRCRQRSALDWHITRRHPHLNVDDNISDDEKRQGRPPGKARTKKISNVKVQELKSPQKPKVQAEKIQTVASTIGRGFKMQHTFNDHNVIDTDKKPIQCDHCSYRCRQRSALDWHITRRHPHLNVDDNTSDDEKRQGYIDRPSGKTRTKTNSNVKVQELKSPQKQKVQAEKIQTAGKRRRPGRPKGKSYRKNKRSRNKAGE